MSPTLLSYIEDHIKTADCYFYYRGKYRTISWSYKKVYDYAKKFGALLKEFGIKKGDRVIIKGRNRPEWIVTYIGCLISGVIAVPLDIRSSDDFEKKAQNKVKAKLKVYSGSENNSRGIASINMEDMEERLAAIKPEESPVTIYPDDLTQIIFTSGTTAVPRGVQITHKNVISNLKSVKPVMDRWEKFFRLMRNLKILSVVPLSHMYGQFIGIYIPLMIRGSVVFMDNINPREILRAIKEERIWILGTLPRVLELLKDYIVRKFNLDSKKFKRKYERFKKIKWPIRLMAFLNIHLRIGLRLVAIIVGGAAFNKNMDEFWRCIAYTIFQGYGLTETAPLVTLADPAQTGAGSIGKVLEGQHIRLVNGEIYVKGENVTPGYFKDATLTKKAFSEGWFKTGDLAVIGKDGNLYFKGRKDTVIVRDDGINIYPEDIESVLKENDSVKDCVVLGLRHGSSLEIHALLLMEDEYKGSVEDIIKKVNKRLNVYQHINSFSIWEGDDFPRTTTGKIKTSEVLKIISSTESPEEDRQKKLSGKPKDIMEAIGSISKIKSKSIQIEARLEKDLGLDSLDLVQLAGTIEEKYNMEVDDSLIGRDTTVGELEKIISYPRKVSQKIPFYNFQFWLIVRIMRVTFQYFIYPFLFIILRLKVKEKERLRNLKGPIVFASNHVSPLDTFTVLYSIPLRLRMRLSVLMSIEHHFKNFFNHTGSLWRRIIETVGFYLLVILFINICPLSRSHGFKQVMENIGKILNRKWSILIFPEGRVTPDGRIRGFEPGIGAIASDMEATVVPVRIRGLFNILKKVYCPGAIDQSGPLLLLVSAGP